MKKIFLIGLIAVFCLNLCGCGFYAVDANGLLKTPELTGEIYSVEKTLKNYIKGNYTLKYPTDGKKRSPLVLDDVDKDGTRETFVFYSTTDKEETLLHIMVMLFKNGKQVVSDEYSISASEIEKIEFCDFDGDGVKEIVVGFEIYGETEKTLTAFNYDFGKLNLLMSNEYTNFVCCDMGSGRNSLIVQKFTPKENSNTITMYYLNDKSFTKHSTCLLDGAITSISNFVYAKLSNGTPAIYIDEIKGIGAITEVIFLSKDNLVNPLFDAQSKAASDATIRSASLPTYDINGDGILEIPVSSAVPNADPSSKETTVYTNWSSFTGEKLTVKKVALVNVSDGYSVNIPNRWIGNIAVLKNSDKRLRTIYAYDADTNTVGERIAVFKTDESSKQDKANKYDKSFTNNGETVTVDLGSYNGIYRLSENELQSIINFNKF